MEDDDAEVEPKTCVRESLPKSTEPSKGVLKAELSSELTRTRVRLAHMTEKHDALVVALEKRTQDCEELQKAFSSVQIEKNDLLKERQDDQTEIARLPHELPLTGKSESEIQDLLVESQRQIDW